MTTDVGSVHSNAVFRTLQSEYFRLMHKVINAVMYVVGLATTLASIVVIYGIVAVFRARLGLPQPTFSTFLAAVPLGALLAVIVGVVFWRTLRQKIALVFFANRLEVVARACLRPYFATGEYSVAPDEWRFIYQGVESRLVLDRELRYIRFYPFSQGVDFYEYLPARRLAQPMTTEEVLGELRIEDSAV